MTGTPVAGVRYHYNGAGLWVAPGHPSLPATVPQGTNLEARQALVLGASYPKPTDATCGLLTDVARTSSGSITATSGQLHQNKDIAGTVTIGAGVSDLTFRNCRVRGTTTAPTGERGLVNIAAGASRNIVFEDCLFQPDVPHYRWNGITGHHFTLTRCTMRDVTDGFGIFNGASPGTDVDCHILGSWVDLLAKFYPDGGIHADGSHNDATQIQGGFNIEIVNTLLDANLNPAAGNTGGFNTVSGGGPYSPPSTTGNASIQLNKNVGQMGGLSVRYSWLYGGNVTVNGLSITDPVLLEFLNNKFGRDSYFNVPARIAAPPTVTWTGNVYEDNGAPVPLNRS